MNDAAISATGVEKSYGDGSVRVNALQRSDFQVGRGEFVIVAGPSGSGKSTLLAVISGLLKPSGGRVVALGRELTALGRDEADKFRLAHFGFIFQGFHLLASLTAVEQVSIVLERQGLKRGLAQERARITLEHVGLGSRLTARPGEMSGGERQRVAVARALAKRPQVIFADEPTSALDSCNGRQIAEMLRAIALEDGAAIVCVSHDPRLEVHADRLARMEDGFLRS
jgi:putative ABC transport system ATP-binding protein